jgi:hypothetical protein
MRLALADIRASPDRRVRPPKGPRFQPQPPGGDKGEQTIHDSLELLPSRGVASKQAYRPLDNPTRSRSLSRAVDPPAKAIRRCPHGGNTQESRAQPLEHPEGPPHGLASRVAENVNKAEGDERRRNVTLHQRYATTEAITTLIPTVTCRSRQPKEYTRITQPAVVRRFLPTRPDGSFKEPCRTRPNDCRAANSSGTDRTPEGEQSASSVWPNRGWVRLATTASNPLRGSITDGAQQQIERTTHGLSVASPEGSTTKETARSEGPNDTSHEVRCLSAKSAVVIVDTPVYLTDAFRSQGFSPSQRFDPTMASRLCFTPHPPIGFWPSELFPPGQPRRLSALRALMPLSPPLVPSLIPILASQYRSSTQPSRPAPTSEP